MSQINEVYQTVVNDLGKSRNGIYPISQFNIDAKRAQLDAFSFYFQGYSASQVLHDALSPFKATLTFTPSGSAGGKVTLPDDYAHLLAADGLLFDNATGKKRGSIRFVNEDELAAALKSQVRPVSISSPIAVGNATTVQLYPEVAQTGQLQYLRLPKAPKYVYTASGRTPIYDADNSVQIEFNDVYLSDLIERIVAYAHKFLGQIETK